MLVLGANGSIQARKGNDMRHCPKCLINFPSSPYPESFPEASCPLCSANDEIDRLKKENKEQGKLLDDTICLLAVSNGQIADQKSRIDRAVDELNKENDVFTDSIVKILTEGEK